MREWLQTLSDHDRPAAAAVDADEQRDYQLFKENEKVRKATYSTHQVYDFCTTNERWECVQHGPLLAEFQLEIGGQKRIMYMHLKK